MQEYDLSFLDSIDELIAEFDFEQKCIRFWIMVDTSVED